MSQTQKKSEDVALEVRNIGGIDETSVTFSPGVTVLAGRNATNRTSLLQAVMAALGSDDVSLKGNAEEGHVELSFGDETYTRTLTRRNGSVVTSGSPYLADPELADLFVFLLESNPARRAVARGDDLRELIMRPVDTEAIRTEIEELEAEKREVDDELDELDSLERRLPELESDRTRLRNEIEETAAELAEKEDELDEADVDVDDTREEKAELESKLEELRDKRSELEDVRFRHETEEESLSALREDFSDLQDRHEELPANADAEIDEIESEIQRLRNRREQIDATVSKLQTIIRFNEDILEGTETDVLDILESDADDGDGGSVTDQLLDDANTVVCWTCGSEVERDEFEETLSRLRELHAEKLDERTAVTADIEDLVEEKDDLVENRRRREETLRRRRDIEDEIERREATIENLEDERAELIEDVQRLEREVEALETEDFSEILEYHREANQLEFELERQREELADVEDEIEDAEARLAERDELEERRDEIRTELRDLRSRIDKIEADAVDAFNRHMAEVLDILEYDNLDRIWIERTETEVREGRRKVERSTFDLHVVRSTEEGTGYEDTVDHLSESEREVTGLVFALAGYLVHDVHEVVPFVLLDSLEAIDSERIALLIDYIREYAPYLVAALLPEDAAALDTEHQRITDI
jgi:chromosome segregation ATPase